MFRVHNAWVLAVVAVRFVSGAAGTTFGQPQEQTGDEFEPNDDFGSAAAIEPGTYGNLSVGKDDIDVYAVELSEGEVASASIQFSHETGDLELALVDRGRANRILSHWRSPPAAGTAVP